MDRRIAPDFQTIEKVNFPLPQQIVLDNQMPLYVINLGEQPVVRLEVVYGAGTWHETVEGASFFTARMLAEGTRRHSSAQISEMFDEIGAFADFSANADRANFMVYGLTKHLPQILKIANELLHEATFPEKELDSLKNVSLQNLRINLEKNGYLATTQFRQRLFGANHPYGRNQNEAAIQHLNPENLRDFYEQFILSQPFRVFLSGKISDAEISLVNQHLGQNKVVATQTESKVFEATTQFEPFCLDKPEAVQSSLRLGRRLFTRQHPDFYAFLVANAVLGGYFGSRLIKNIREEKGLTYSISSGMAPLRQDGFWTISADVKKESVQLVLDEIAHEINVLQTELVSDNELETVKNYLSGEFAGGLNTPFEMADRVRLMVLENLDLDYYDQHIARLRAVSAEEIRVIAQKYWQSSDLLQVVVG